MLVKAGDCAKLFCSWLLRRASGAPGSSCPRRRALPDLRGLRRGVACASRSRRARSGAGARGQDRQRGHRRADRGGLNLKVEEGRRLDPKVPGRPDRGAGAGRRRADPARAQRQGLGQRRSAIDGGSGARRRIRAHGAAARAAGGARSWPRRRDPIGRLPAGTSSRRIPPPKTKPAGRAARQPRRARRELRDARSDRRQRRSRRRPAARAGSASRSSATIPIPASPPGSSCARTRRPGFQIAPGEPISLEVSR